MQPTSAQELSRWAGTLSDRRNVLVDRVREKRGRRDVVHASTANSAVSFFFIAQLFVSVNNVSVR